MKLRHKLIAGFLIISLLIWATGFFVFSISKRTLREAYVQSDEALAVEIIDSINKIIHGRIEVFRAYARDELLHDAIRESNRIFSEMDHSESYIDLKDREWTSALQGKMTPFMKEILNRKLSIKLIEKIEYFEEEYDYKVYGEVFVTNKYGANIAQTGRTSDYRQNDEEWWQSARSDGLYVQDVAYDESSGVYSIDIGIRIDDEDGGFMGIMKVILNIEEIIHILEHKNHRGVIIRHDTEALRLLTKDGKLIYSNLESEKFLDDASYLLDKGHVNPGSEHPEISGTVHPLTDNISSSLDHKKQIIFIHADSSGYRDFRGLGWILVITREAEEIFAPVFKLRNRILSISFIVTALAALMGIIFSASISRNLIKLSKAATKIGKGGLDTVIDITSKDEIGELAGAFQQMTDNLRHINAEREKINKELARSNNELQDFAYAASHDLQEPLRKITVFGDRLTDRYAGLLGDQGKDYLQRMQGAARRMQILINDLLTYSRVTTQATPYVPVDLNNVVKEVLSDLEVRVEQVKGRLDAGDLPVIDADPLQMRQLMQNLIGNALKFNKQDEAPVVKVYGTFSNENAADPENNCYQLTVEDNGIGFEEQYADRIFGVFQRLHGRCEYEGSGIGLSICKKIVERHGGTIAAKSSPGKGATFTVSLPVKQSSGEEAANVQE